MYPETEVVRIIHISTNIINEAFQHPSAKFRSTKHWKGANQKAILATESAK